LTLLDVPAIRGSWVHGYVLLAVVADAVRGDEDNEKVIIEVGRVADGVAAGTREAAWVGVG
jgi:hypothetical protein